MAQNISLIFKSDVLLDDLGSLCDEIAKLEGVSKVYPVFPNEKEAQLARIAMLEIKEGYKPYDILEKVKESYSDKLENIQSTPMRYSLKINK
ncbi:MAG: hypothetical protein Q8R37_06005 [Nanoarchaeota archaeon]|nr:hypothetical protein [Nanoarchaeota archaeon]